jgi:hypothetical protein
MIPEINPKPWNQDIQYDKHLQIAHTMNIHIERTDCEMNWWSLGTVSHLTRGQLVNEKQIMKIIHSTAHWLHTINVSIDCTQSMSALNRGMIHVARWTIDANSVMTKAWKTNIEQEIEMNCRKEQRSLNDNCGFILDWICVDCERRIAMITWTSDEDARPFIPWAYSPAIECHDFPSATSILFAAFSLFSRLFLWHSKMLPSTEPIRLTLQFYHFHLLCELFKQCLESWHSRCAVTKLWPSALLDSIPLHSDFMQSFRLFLSWSQLNLS